MRVDDGVNVHPALDSAKVTFGWLLVWTCVFDWKRVQVEGLPIVVFGVVLSAMVGNAFLALLGPHVFDQTP